MTKKKKEQLSRVILLLRKSKKREIKNKQRGKERENIKNKHANPCHCNNDLTFLRLPPLSTRIYAVYKSLTYVIVIYQHFWTCVSLSRCPFLSPVQKGSSYQASLVINTRKLSNLNGYQITTTPRLGKSLKSVFMLLKYKA